MIPKSITPAAFARTSRSSTFQLDGDDMDAIARLDYPQNGKTGSRPEEFNELY